MAMRIAVFGAENGTNFVDTSKVGGYGALLCELGGLSQKCVAAKVPRLENFSARFSSGRLKFWCVNLDETVLLECGTEDAADTGPDSEDTLGRRGA